MEDNLQPQSELPILRGRPWLFATEIFIVVLICIGALVYKTGSVSLPKSDRITRLTNPSPGRFGWISDHEFVSFRTLGPTQYQFVKQDINGSISQLSPVPPNIGAEIDKSWSERLSPDGTKVVYSGSRFHPSYSVYDIQTGRVITWLISDREAFSMFWLEASKRFAVIEQFGMNFNFVIRTVDKPSELYYQALPPQTQAHCLLGSIVGKKAYAVISSGVNASTSGGEIVSSIDVGHAQAPLTTIEIAPPGNHPIQFVIPTVDGSKFALIVERFTPTLLIWAAFPPWVKTTRMVTELWVYNSKSKCCKKLAEREHYPRVNGAIYMVEWLPGNKAISYVSDGILWKVNAD